jgi:hypothetical protein
MSFPDRIQIPVVTAAGLNFEGDLTARDQSILLLVGWYAALNGTDENGMIDVPDLEMRQALGGLKTRRSDRDDQYHARLGNAAIRTDERLPDLADGVPAPVVTPGMRRVTVRGAHRWQVDEALVEGFRLREGEPVVEIPMNLLAQARCRFTLPLLLRALAWQAGDVERHWIHRRRTKAVEYKLSLSDVQDLMGVDYAAAALERTVLAPAILEIDRFTDLAIEYMPIARPGMQSKRARAFIIMVGTAEPIVYAAPRRIRSFGDMRKPAPVERKIVPIRLPFGRSNRRVLQVDDTEDVPF